MDEIRAAPVRVAPDTGRHVRRSELADVYAAFHRRLEVDPGAQQRIVDRLENPGLAARLPGRRARLEAFVLAELERRVAIAPELGQD